MGRVWSDRQLDRATPPQSKDLRGKAFLQAVNRYLGINGLPGPHIRDPETCPAEVLPALIAEYSMEEFISPDLPEHLVRRILKNRWPLQSLEGYDDGVTLGLALLGMSAEIVQWYQTEPKGQANTHIVYFGVEEFFHPDSQDYFDSRYIDAARRMIDATKRWSQGTEMRTRISAKPPAYVGAYADVTIFADAPSEVPPAPKLSIGSGVAVIPTVEIHARAGG